MTLVKRSDLIAFARFIMNGSDPVTPKDNPDWLSMKQVSVKFAIPYNNLKSAKWRAQHNFPTHQPDGPYTTPLFNIDEVSEWLKKK